MITECSVIDESFSGLTLLDALQRIAIQCETINTATRGGQG